MLFVFAVMLLNVSADSPLRVPLSAWIGPLVLIAVLLAELIYGIGLSNHALAAGEVGPQRVSDALFGPYVLGVELASVLLLAALIGARHIAAQPAEAPLGDTDAGAAARGAGAEGGEV
jgi:NADH-quinone oxidoreductase subunit J